jgi:hypothetical protein
MTVSVVKGGVEGDVVDIVEFIGSALHLNQRKNRPIRPGDCLFDVF